MADAGNNAEGILAQIEAAAQQQQGIINNAPPHQGTDLTNVNPDFYIPDIHYAVPYAQAVELGWKFDKPRPVTAEGNFVDSRRGCEDMHFFIAPAVTDGTFVYENIPNFPTMSAYFYKGFKEIARRLRSYRHLHNPAMVGTLADSINAAIDSQVFQDALALLPATDRDGRLLQEYLTTIQTFVGKPIGDIAWMGVPLHESQLIRTIQLMVAKVSPQFEAPPAPRTFELLTEIDNLALEVSETNAQLLSGAGAATINIARLTQSETRLKAMARQIGTLTWHEWCVAARRPRTSNNIEELQNARRAAREIEQEMNQSTSGAAPQQVIVTHDSSSQAAPISPANLARLEKYLLEQKTQDIQLEEIKLLVDAVGPAIEMMQPGGSDLSKIDMSPRMSDFIKTVQMELYRPGGHRWVPEIALLKLLTMRFGSEDQFVLNHFGLLMFEDDSDAPKKPLHIKGPTRTLTVEPARGHIWERIRTWAQLTAVLDGLADAVHRLLHPSILSRDDILALGRALRKIYDDSQARANISDLKQILTQKLSERARDLRTLAAGAAADLPPFDSFEENTASGALWARANMNATFASQLFKSRHRFDPDGETLIGRRHAKPEGIDASGRERAYKRRNPPGGEPPKDGKKQRQYGETPPGSHAQHQQQAPEFKDDCLRCGKPGHRAWGCQNKPCKIKAAWMDPGKRHLRHIAELVRRQAKVAIEYEKPPSA